MTHRIFVAIPTLSGKLTAQTQETLTRFYAEAHVHGWDVTELRWQGDSLIPHARNALIGFFLESDCTDMIFLDSDIGVGVGVFSRLMKHPVDLVCVAYRLKKDDEVYPIHYMDKADLWADPETGLLEVLNVPFGLVRIRRTAIEKMVADHPDDWFMVTSAPKTKTWCLFNTELKDNVFWGEDFYFCRLFREGGGRVWVDPEVAVDHVNSDGKVFAGHFGNWLRNRQQ